MDEIAEIIERLDNISASLSLPVPDQIHVAALRESLPEIRDELKSAYIDIGGIDHWKE